LIEKCSESILFLNHSNLYKLIHSVTSAVKTDRYKSENNFRKSNWRVRINQTFC